MNTIRRLVILTLVCTLLASLSAPIQIFAGKPIAQRGLKNHPVILIHGFGAKDERWDEKTVWQTLEHDGYNMDLVWRFKYPPKADGNEDSQGDVTWIANKLMQDIDKLSRMSQALGGPAKVDLVGHSLGGLIARYYMSRKSPDQHGTVFHRNVRKLIELGVPNQGSFWANLYISIYETGARNLPTPLSTKFGPIGQEIQKAIVDFLIDELYQEFDVPVPVPTSPALRQVAVNSPFLRSLNQAQNSPKDVDYSCLYGDIKFLIEMDLFGWKITSPEVGVGDLVVGVESATSIPGIGDLKGGSPNYHAYGYPVRAKFGLGLKLENPFLEVTNPFEIMEAIEPFSHTGLMENDTVKHDILDILNRGFIPATPSPGFTSTSTVLVLDISGSMDEPHRGRRKIDAAKDAATDILNMIEQESQIGEVLHQVAIVTFSTDAWLNLPLTTDYAQARDIVAKLKPTKRTNIGAAITVANEALQSAPADSKKIIILLSDGLTNEGLPPEAILSGPVQEAANAGTCIYTVGFGDPGDLDEELLRRIAEITGCKYYYATDAYQLENIYIKLRHESLGNVIGEFSGQVAQGETVTVGQVEVAPNQGELYVTLNWPGSTLDLILTDPNGRRVDENYPGVTISTFARLVYIIVANPIPGIWQAAVFGRDVPEGLIDYSAIFSTRERVIQPTDYGPLLLVVVLMLGLAAVFFVVITQARPAYGVRVVQGYGPSGLVGFRRGVINIGRDPRNDLVLFDKKVSRHHSQIRLERGWPVIYDLGSTNGTFVNGQRVTRQVLRNGDIIRVGDTELIFHALGTGPYPRQ